VRSFLLNNRWVFFGVVLILLFILIALIKTAFTPAKTLPTKNNVPNPTNYTPSVFQYDSAKAEKLLTQYIKDTIKPEFLPAKIEVKRGLSIDGRTEDVRYEFGSMFTTNQASFSANFHFKENVNTANDYSIFIQPRNTTQTTATASLANSLLTSYFTNPYLIANCQTKGVTSYCENFQTFTEEKKGYGIALINSTRKLMSIVFSCSIPKESKSYDTQKSCIVPQ